MIRNGGKITKSRIATTNSSTSGANGVYDTIDAFNARSINSWPITPNYSTGFTNALTMNEGAQFFVTNISSGVTADTTLYYDVENIVGNARAFLKNPTGSFQQLSSNQRGTINLVSIDVSVLNPSRDPATFKVNVRIGSITGSIINTTSIVTIPTPICTVYFPDATPITEIGDGNEYKNLYIQWSGVGFNGVYSVAKVYNIAWSGTANANTDFTSVLPSTVTGLSQSNFSSTGSTIVPKKDFLTEGTETLTATVTDAANGWVLGTASFNITDTSLTPIATITSSKNTLVEGESVGFQVSIENPDNDYLDSVYYVITGSAASKFSNPSGYVSYISVSGNKYIISNFNLNSVNNFVYGQPDTTFQVNFYNYPGGYLYGTSQVITVKDPAQPGATITTVSSVNEGTTNAFVVNTTNIDGNTLNWTITKLTGTVTRSDFFNAMSGSFVATNGTGTIYINPRSDTYTEGTETFKLEVKLPDNQLLASTNFTVNDTSTGTAEDVDLYDFSTFRFGHGTTTSFNTGNNLSTFLSTYSTSAYPWITNTSYYNVDTPGIQQWTVPFTGRYLFKVAGAQGGGWAGNTGGGGGALMSGEVLLTKGTVLNIVAGKAGKYSGSTATGGGGGGGTFVYTGTIGGTGLLFAAGGGGGADDSAVSGQSAREDFYAGTNNAAIRTNPLDGQGAPAGGAGGGSGCGWLSDSTGVGAGTRFTGGAALGLGGVGGWGGGGGDQDDGGGGGGYTGGTSTTATAGGCGGSYINTALIQNYTWLYYNQNFDSYLSASSGFVEITGTPIVSATITPSTSTITEGQSVTFNIVTNNFSTGILQYQLLVTTGVVYSLSETGTRSGSVSIDNSVGQVSITFNNDLATEGTEAFKLLLTNTVNSKTYTVGTSSTVTVEDTSTGTQETYGSRAEFLRNSSNSSYELNTTQITVVNFAGTIAKQPWVVLLGSGADDSSYEVPLPFGFKIAGNTYNSAHIGTNVYMTFGGGANTFTVTATSPASIIPYPKLMWGISDSSAQRIYYRIDPRNRFVLIRFEGSTTNTTTTPGAPNIVAEIRLFNPEYMGGQSVIEIKFNSAENGNRLSLSSADSYYVGPLSITTNTQYNYVFYSLNAQATSWNVLGSYNGSGSSYTVVI